MTRPRDVALSAKTYWLLQRVAAARRKDSSSYIEQPWTADRVAEEILSDHLAQAFPELVSMYEARDKINSEAESVIAEQLNKSKAP